MVTSGRGYKDPLLMLLVILISAGLIEAADDVAFSRPLRCFFADLHSHTSYSDGVMLPADAFRHARKVAKIDVFALTDHMGSLDEKEWTDTLRQGKRANESGQFVTLPGIEWTQKYGHACILGATTKDWPKNIAGLYKAAADRGAVLKINHPGDGTGCFDGLSYSPIGDRAVKLMEVRNPDEEKAYLRALRLGWHLAPDGSTDAHRNNWGNRGHWTVIQAPALTQKTIWEALKARHCYSTSDRNCRLFFKINDMAVMGDILVAMLVSQIRIKVLVNDPDASDQTDRIELFEDGTIIQSERPLTSVVAWETTCSPPAGNHYYFVKVIQVDGNTMWSAPIWLTKINQSRDSLADSASHPKPPSNSPSQPLLPPRQKIPSIESALPDGKYQVWEWHVLGKNPFKLWLHQGGLVGRSPELPSNPKFTWSRSEKTITVRWPQGWVDTMILEPGGRSLSGRNESGTRITAKLIE